MHPDDSRFKTVNQRSIKNEKNIKDLNASTDAEIKKLKDHITALEAKLENSKTIYKYASSDDLIRQIQYLQTRIAQLEEENKKLKEEAVPGFFERLFEGLKQFGSKTYNFCSQCNCGECCNNCSAPCFNGNTIQPVEQPESTAPPRLEQPVTQQSATEQPQSDNEEMI